MPTTDQSASNAERIQELKREVLEDKESFGAYFHKMTAEYAIRQGTRFKELKGLVGDKKWRPWLKREGIGINPRTCELYIEIAANKDDAIAYTKSISHFTLNDFLGHLREKRGSGKPKKTAAQRASDCHDKMNGVADKEQQALDLLDELRNAGFTDNFLRAVRDDSGIPEALAGLARREAQAVERQQGNGAALH